MKLTDRSELLLNEKYILTMKMAKEEPKKIKKKESKENNKSKASGILQEEDEPLFQKLRQLRMEIARKEKVPPYIVFSDKTLVHMCMIKPQNKEEMLSVSGVGEHKYAKYGQQFGDCQSKIAKYQKREIKNRQYWQLTENKERRKIVL